MKNLVLGSLFALTSLTTGCIITTDDDPPPPPPGDAVITAEWSFKELATNSTTGCPAGFDTVQMIQQAIDEDGRPVGEPFVDKFRCTDNRHAGAPVPPDVYRVWLEVTNMTGSSIYAKSTDAVVDVLVADKTFTATILHDGGYFIFDWALRGAQSNAPLGCEEAPSGIEITSTIAGTSQAIADKFNCSQGTGVTGGLIADDYTVSVAALEGELATGVAPAQNATIRDRNQLTDLGVITIPIDGK